MCIRDSCLPIANIPVGEMIHRIELYPGKGAQLVRAAGDAAQLMAKENGMAQVRLPSGEVRYVREECKATIGQVGNTDWANIQMCIRDSCCSRMMVFTRAMSRLTSAIFTGLSSWLVAC